MPTLIFGVPERLDAVLAVPVKEPTNVVAVTIPVEKIWLVVTIPSVDTYESGIQIQCELTYLDYSISEFLQFRFDRQNNIL